MNYRFWHREFGGEAGVVGKTVSLEGHAVPIVGVTPASFNGVTPGRGFDVALLVCSEPVFEPEKYHDHYREALEEMIEAKVAGDETTKPAAVTAKADVVDLMAALQASVDAAKKSRGAKPAASSESDEDEEPPAKKKPAARKRAPKSA